MSPLAVPLVAARRRYGWRTLGLGGLALALIVCAIILQSPPSLRHGGVILALILVAMCVGISALSLLWVWIIVWPTEQRRLAGAERLHKQAAPPMVDKQSFAPFIVLVVGGLLVAVVLWGGLKTVGLVGAPMLWIVAGTINLEVARKVRRAERAAQALYYETPPTFPFRGDRRLFVQQLSTGGRRPSPGGDWRAAVAKGRAAPGGRKRAMTGRVRQ